MIDKSQGSVWELTDFDAKFVGWNEQWVFANTDVQRLNALSDSFEDILVFLATVSDEFAVLLLHWLEDSVLGLLLLCWLVLEHVAGGDTLEDWDCECESHLFGGLVTWNLLRWVGGAAIGAGEIGDILKDLLGASELMADLIADLSLGVFVGDLGLLRVHLT